MKRILLFIYLLPTIVANAVYASWRVSSVLSKHSTYAFTHNLKSTCLYEWEQPAKAEEGNV